MTPALPGSDPARRARIRAHMDRVQFYHNVLHYPMEKAVMEAMRECA